MNAFQLGIINNIKRKQPIVEGEFLTFSSDNPFSIKFNQKTWDGVLEYSTDTQNWTEWDASEIYSVDNALYLRGTGNSSITGIAALSDPENTPNYAIQINATSGVTCAGNIMTLLDHENPDTVVMDMAAFAVMFFGCTSLTSAPALPATMLAAYCYMGMFSYSSLTTAPELPATTLAESCYTSMFYECTSLTSTPELPATILAEGCYSTMFSNCTNLTTAPELPATTLAKKCYQGMFYECTGIKISSTQTGIYQTLWRIPTTGTGITATDWSFAMLTRTGGTFTDDPTINTTYYQAG